MGDVPGVMFWHSCAALGGALFLLDNDPFNDAFGFLQADLRKYDVAANAWSIVDVSGIKPRHGAFYSGNLVHVRDFLWLLRFISISGFFGMGHTNEIWVFNPGQNTWRDMSLQVRGASPRMRGGHGCTVADNRIYIFSGSSTGTPGGGTAMSDLWMLDSDDGYLRPDAVLVWTELSGALLGSAPAGRIWGGIVALGDRMYIFGGEVGGVQAWEYASELYAFTLPERRPWPSEETYAVDMASLYDWDALVLNGGARNSLPGGDFSLCSNLWPCHFRVVGPGTISASVPFSLSCRDTYSCIGMEFESVHVTGEGRAVGFSLHLSGAPLQVLNSTFFGTKVTVGGAKMDLRSSTCVDCTFVLEKGAGLSVYLSNFLGGASSQIWNSRPAVYLDTGTSATIKSCKFGNLHSTSSGAAFIVMGSQLEVVDSTFFNCSSGGSGGAIHGEPIANSNGEMRTKIEISSSTFSECEAAGSGGGVSSMSAGTRVHVSNSVFARCRALSGGALCAQAESPLTVDAATSFIECSATEDGGAISVVGGRYMLLESSTFRNCTASNRGGAVFVSGGGVTSASATVSSCGFLGSGALGVGGGAMYLSGIRHIVGKLECRDNTALFGGGGVLMWDGVFPTEIYGGGVSICDLESSNHAGYGAVVASSYKRLELQGVPPLGSLQFAGLPLEMRVSKRDYYGQTIASDSSSLMQAKTSWGGARLVDPSVQLEGTIVSAVKAGTATFLFSVKPSFSRVDVVSRTTELVRTPMVYFEGTDADVGGQMLSDVAEISLAQNGAVCPQGYVLSLSGDKESANRLGQCAVCQVETYSLHPLAGGSSTGDPACLSCPAGGNCLAGGDDVRFPLGTWGVVEGKYVLQTCPIGTELTTSNAADECENPPWSRCVRIPDVDQV